MFGFDMLRQDDLTKTQTTKIIIISVLPTVYYINAKMIGMI